MAFITLPVPPPDYNRAVRILLTRLSALGDIVHAWPLAVAARRLPGVTALAWVVEQPLAPLLAGHTDVDVVIPVATRQWRRRPWSRATRTELAASRTRVRGFAPDVVLDPQGLVKSAVWAPLSRAARRIGFSSRHRRERLAGAFYSETVAPPRSLRHVVDLNLSLLEPLGATPPYGASPDGSHLLAGPGPRPQPGTVTLVPATGGAGKRWPEEAFAELSRALLAAGHPVAVAWGPAEQPLAHSIAERGGPGVELAPPTTIAELAVYLAASAMVVGGDTGPVHLAASLGVPTLAVFVATDPARNGPRGTDVTVISAAASGASRGRARTAANGAVAVADVADAALSRLERGTT